MATRRITLDIDGGYHAVDSALRTLSSLCDLVRIGVGAYRIDRTFHGWHIVARLDFTVSDRGALRLRKLLGDDPVRVRLDKRRPRWARGILWTEKDGYPVRVVAECQ